MSKKLLVSFAICSVLAVGCGESDDDIRTTAYSEHQQKENSIYASWESIQPAIVIQGNSLRPGLNGYITLTFDENSVTYTLTCISGEVTATAQVSSSATISANTIIVHSNANKTVTQNGITCTASLTPGKSDYQIEDNYLTLSNPNDLNQPQFVFYRT